MSVKLSQLRLQDRNETNCERVRQNTLVREEARVTKHSTGNETKYGRLLIITFMSLSRRKQRSDEIRTTHNDQNELITATNRAAEIYD